MGMSVTAFAVWGDAILCCAFLMSDAPIHTVGEALFSSFAERLLGHSFCAFTLRVTATPKVPLDRRQK